LALVQTLNARILSSRSATATLEGWCAARGLTAEQAADEAIARIKQLLSE